MQVPGSKATRKFDSVAIILADNTLAYTAGAGKDVVTAGDVIPVEGGRYRYRVAASDATDHHSTTAGGVKLYADSNEEEVQLSAAIDFTGGADCCLPGVVMKQANGANLAEVCTVALSNISQDRRGTLDLHVDGNKANNNPVTGIKVSQFKKNSGYGRLSADDCDIGVNITGNVEYCKLDIHSDGCGTGVLVDDEAGITPDELILNVMAHDCDKFFEVSGTIKSSGYVVFGCEQSNSWGAAIAQGWWEIHGTLRIVGKTGDGGLKISDDAIVTGRVRLLGGDNTNCAQLVDVEGGEVESLTVIMGGQYKDGARIAGGTEGAIRVITQTAPNATGSETCLKLGISGGSVLNGFGVLPGTTIESGNIAIDFANAANCVVDPAKLVGNVVIGSGSYGNTLFIPRRQAESLVTFANSRTQLDNKIVFRGSFSLSELNALNGGTNGSGCFRGMEAESCTDFRGASAYFDGDFWIPCHGVIKSGEITIPNGATYAVVAHGLGYDPAFEQISVIPIANWGSATEWYVEADSTNIGVFLDVDPGESVKFSYRIMSNDR